MRIKDRRRGAMVLVLALLTAALLPVMTASAGNVPDYEKSYTLQVELNNNNKELRAEGVEVPLRLYKVADFTEDGYDGVGEFADVDFTGCNSDARSEDIAAVAQECAKVVDEGNVTPTDTITLTGGAGKAVELEAGLYLLHSETVDIDLYTYTTMPALVAVPGAVGGVWQDVTTAEIKTNRIRRECSIEIIKTLKKYNVDLGPAQFIFMVTRVVDGETKSNPVTIEFNDAGTRSVTVDGIPAGAEVTVEEVYWGSYEPEGPSKLTYQLKYQQAEENEAIAFRFTNTYSGKMIRSNTLVNHYQYDGMGWTVKQYSDNTAIGGNGGAGENTDETANDSTEENTEENENTSANENAE